MNGYYALYLYGLATGNDALRDWGHALLAMEIFSARTYWQITTKDDPQIYPPAFAPNKVVGVLWSSKVDYTTFFGANVEFIHCIQVRHVASMAHLTCELDATLHSNINCTTYTVLD